MELISREQVIATIDSFNVFESRSDQIKLELMIGELPIAEVGTNLASLGTDAISRQQAIDALREYLVGKRCPDDGTLTCRLIENEVINKLPPAEPKKRGMNIEQEKMIVESLPSLYPMQKFEEDAIEVVLDALLPAEPKKGKWIKTARWGRVYYCNQCRNYLDFDGVNAGRGSTNFCPNCGADMRQKGESSEND